LRQILFEVRQMKKIKQVLANLILELRTLIARAAYKISGFLTCLEMSLRIKAVTSNYDDNTKQKSKSSKRDKYKRS